MGIQLIVKAERNIIENVLGDLKYSLFHLVFSVYPFR